MAHGNITATKQKINFMSDKTTYKERINEILIKKKMYRDPDFSARKLGEMLGVENYKVSRILKREFGQSYSDIILCKRIEEAKKLLLDKNYSQYTVDDVGVMVGFKNRQSFFDAFKKFEESTPQHWRNSNRQ